MHAQLAAAPSTSSAGCQSTSRIAAHGSLAVTNAACSAPAAAAVSSAYTDSPDACSCAASWRAGEQQVRAHSGQARSGPGRARFSTNMTGVQDGAAQASCCHCVCTHTHLLGWPKQRRRVAGVDRQVLTALGHNSSSTSSGRLSSQELRQQLRCQACTGAASRRRRQLLPQLQRQHRQQSLEQQRRRR